MKRFIMLLNFLLNAVSGPAVAQWWPSSYILPFIPNGEHTNT